MDFENRILATRGFVLENLKSAVRHKDLIEEICAAADQRLAQPNAAIYFGYDTTLVDGRLTDVLVGSREQVELPEGRTRSVATAEFHPEPMRVQVAYRSRQHTALPRAWAITEPTRAVLENLTVHGIQIQELRQTAQVQADYFQTVAVNKSQRLFQGHNEISLEGAWQSYPTAQALSQGTAIISATQPLARLAAQLLEPMSEDSLSTWNYFEGRESYPVLHLSSIDGLVLGPLIPRQNRQPRPAPQREAEPALASARGYEGRTLRSISLERRSNGFNRTALGRDG